MTTAVDINDLIPQEAALVRQVLQEIALYPQIRQPVLRFLLAEDFPALVAMVRENTDNIRLILERLGVVEEAVAHIPAIEEQVARIPAIEEQIARIPAIEEELRSVRRDVNSLQGSFGRFRGESYENACREQIAAILDGFLEWPVLADRERINHLLVAARHANRITRAELIDGYNADIIARAKDENLGAGTLAVLEATITFNRQDLEAAARRAEIIRRVVGVPVAAYLVTHHDWPAEMDAAASALGVTLISYPLDKYALD